MGKRYDMKKTLFLIFLCFVFLNTNCAQNKMYFAGKIIELSGKIKYKYFNNIYKNGNHIIENVDSDNIEYVILELDEPIDIAKDAFGGPVHDVRVIQLIPEGNKIINKLKGNINKHGVLKGKLGYAISAYDFEKVCFLLYEFED